MFRQARRPSCRRDGSLLDDRAQQIFEGGGSQLLLGCEPIVDIFAMRSAAFLKQLVCSLTNLRVIWFDLFRHSLAPG